MAVRKEDLDQLSYKYSGEKSNEVLSTILLGNAGNSSGNRLQMFGASHSEQMIMLDNPHTPLVSSGFEKAFGKYTDSRLVAEKNYIVVGILNKFPANRAFPKYTYVVRDEFGEHDVIEVSHYESLSKEHGYIRPITTSDNFQVGSTIPKDTVIYRSNNHDEFGNYRYGRNVNVAYIGLPEVVEDGIRISKSMARDFSYHTVNTVDLIVNSNDVLLNIYGTPGGSFYKSYPDIGESVQNGIVAIRRKIEYSNAASELTDRSLSEMQLNDSPFRGNGTVVDVDVYINKPEELENHDIHRSQIFSYFTLSLDYHRRVLATLGPIIKGKLRHTTRLQQMYEKSLDFVQVSSPESNVKFDSPNGGAFEFALIRITTVTQHILETGSKITNRVGGKSVACTIVDDEMMPIDQYGVRADMITSPAGVPGRANTFQMNEQEINFISSRILEKIKQTPDMSMKINILIEFLSNINPRWAEEYAMFLRNMMPHALQMHMNFVENNGIIIQEPPGFEGFIGYDKIIELYDKYKIKPGKIRMRREFDQSYKDRLHQSKDGMGDGLFFDIYEHINPNNDEETISPEELYANAHKLDPSGETWPSEFLELGEEGFVHPSSNQSNLPVFKKTKAFAEETRVISTGNGMVVREFTSQVPVIIAPIYIVLLEHTPDSKFSARSIGTINSLGLPAKSGYLDKELPFSGTPIRFGDMETFNAASRIRMEIINRLRATYSTHPELRFELAKILLIKDPLELWDLAIKSEDIKDTIPAKLLQVYFYTLGKEIYDDSDPVFDLIKF